MKATKSKITRAIPRRAKVNTCDNSGAKVVQVISVKKSQYKKRQNTLSLCWRLNYCIRSAGHPRNEKASGLCSTGKTEKGI